MSNNCAAAAACTLHSAHARAPHRLLIFGNHVAHLVEGPAYETFAALTGGFRVSTGLGGDGALPFQTEAGCQLSGRSRRRLLDGRRRLRRLWRAICAVCAQLAATAAQLVLGPTEELAVGAERCSAVQDGVQTATAGHLATAGAGDDRRGAPLVLQQSARRERRHGRPAGRPPARTLTPRQTGTLGAGGAQRAVAAPSHHKPAAQQRCGLRTQGTGPYLSVQRSAVSAPGTHAMRKARELTRRNDVSKTTAVKVHKKATRGTICDSDSVRAFTNNNCHKTYKYRVSQNYPNIYFSQLSLLR